MSVFAYLQENHLYEKKIDSAMKDKKVDKNEEAKIKRSIELAKRDIDKGNVKEKMAKVKHGLKDVKGKVQPSMFADIIDLYEMVQEWISGRYKGIPWETIVTAVVVLLYIVSPVDIIPDVIPVAGWLDDGWVMTRLVPAIQNDVQKYKDWRDDEEGEMPIS